jgi:hypothetical protein
MAVKEVSSEIIENIIDEAIKHFESKREKKGNESFNSIWESFGKICEEHYEITKALHKKDRDEYRMECLDKITTLLWAIMSEDAQDEQQ